MSTATPAKKKTSPVTPVKKSVKAPAKTPAKAPVSVKTSAPTHAIPKVDKKKEKTEKVKVVRDSFTIPKTEYTQIAAMKKRAMDMGLEVKKSELIRAGLLLLSSASDAGFRKALGNVPTLKTGRPGKA